MLTLTPLAKGRIGNTVAHVKKILAAAGIVHQPKTGNAGFSWLNGEVRYRFWKVSSQLHPKVHFNSGISKNVSRTVLIALLKHYQLRWT